MPAYMSNDLIVIRFRACNQAQREAVEAHLDVDLARLQVMVIRPVAGLHPGQGWPEAPGQSASYGAPPSCLPAECVTVTTAGSRLRHRFASSPNLGPQPGRRCPPNHNPRGWSGSPEGKSVLRKTAALRAPGCRGGELFWCSWAGCGEDGCTLAATGATGNHTGQGSEISAQAGWRQVTPA